MKKINLFVILVSMLVVIVSCSTNDDSLFDDPLNGDPQFEEPINIPINSATELIIQFKENVPRDKKEELRNNYDVISYEPCHCTDDTIEKCFWHTIDYIFYAIDLILK